MTILRFVLHEPFGSVVSLVARKGYIGDPHGEPVSLFQRQVAQKQLSVAKLVEHSHFNGMHALRQDFFGHETARAVNGHLVSRHPHPVFFGNRVTVCMHRTAVKGNIANGDASFAITNQQLLAQIRFCYRRVDLVDHPQRLAARFVKKPLFVVNPHQIF